MKNKTVYIEKGSTNALPKKMYSFKVFSTIFVSLFIGVVSLLSSFSPSLTQNASADDPIQWFMCYFGEDSPTAMIYQTTQTSDLQFELFSRSVATPSLDNVDSGLNSILKVSGQDFKAVNESILGVSLDGITSVNNNTAATFNSGPKVSVYDRFGVSGLTFTYYMGEWKYIIVDACNPESEPVDPHAGLYYKGRLEPASTYGDIFKSTDVRTEQYSESVSSMWPKTLSTFIANIIFGLTKVFVTLTIAFINLAFSDITHILGIDDQIGSGQGIFFSLFNGIFMPFIITAFVITGFSILWTGIVKRQYRQAFGTLARTIALYLAAIIFSIMPLTFINIPNNVAILGQSLILNTMNTGLQGGSGLCDTEIGSVTTTQIVDSTSGTVTTDIEDNQSILSEASKNMSSVVGCQYWQTFLFTPWVQGQWGTTWDQLWANDSIPEWADEGSASLGNVNDEMVGNAAVPLGDGTFINNWAVFQVSTQTNAHAPYELDGQLSKYSSRVANDWWRIVDANANYQEENIETDVSGSGNNKAFSIEYNVPKDNPTLPGWDEWVGNNNFDKIFVSLSSLLIACIGLAAPFFFALLSAVYSFGVAILMAISPIMLLLGCFGNRGWEFFKGWAELVINLTIKRIVVGLLLALSISFTTTAIYMMQDVGWIQGIIVLVLLSILLVQSRHKVFDALASIRFSNVNFSDTAKKTGDVLSKGSKSIGRIGAAGAAGAYTSKKYGGDATSGFTSGMKNELKSQLYSSKSELARGALTTYEDISLSTGQDKLDHENLECATCGVPLYGGEIIIGRDGAGNYYCRMCMEESEDPDMREMVINTTRRETRTVNTPVIEIDPVEESKDVKVREKMWIDNISRAIKTAEDDPRSVRFHVPEDLKPFINEEKLEIGYKSNNFDYIRRAFSYAVYQLLAEELPGNQLPDNSPDSIFMYMDNYKEDLESRGDK